MESSNFHAAKIISAVNFFKRELFLLRDAGTPGEPGPVTSAAPEAGGTLLTRTWHTRCIALKKREPPCPELRQTYFHRRTICRPKLSAGCKWKNCGPGAMSWPI